jgi:MFS family permease
MISLTGAWMGGTAQGWLVYALTSDAFFLGLVGFASQVPVLALGLFAGIAADSFNRHKLLVMTQTLIMAQTLALAALTLVHGADGKPVVALWHILTLVVFSGIVQAFDMPARQTFLVQMVPKEDLGNAVALNSLTFNAARVLGPSMAGALIAIMQKLRPEVQFFGEGMCFLINGLSFVAVIVQLLRMKVEPRTVRPFRGSTTGYLLEGIAYLKKRRHIGALLFFVGMLTLFGLPYLVLMPVFARDLLGGDSRTFGYLMTSVGVGAMAGGIRMARRVQVRGLGRLMAVYAVGFSLIIILFSWVSVTAISCVALGIAGFTMVTTMIGAQTLVQTLVSEEFRGRVMSFYMMMNVGLMPFGSLLTGAAAHRFGARWAMTADAVVCLITALVFARHLPILRMSARETPEYQQVIAAD